LTTDYLKLSEEETDLDKVVYADKVAILVVSELPWVAMCYQLVGNRQSLGKVNHPRVDVDVITNDQQRTTDYLHKQVQK